MTGCAQAYASPSRGLEVPRLRYPDLGVLLLSGVHQPDARVHGRVAPAALVVDVDAADSLVSLDKHPLVRQALDRSGLGSAVNPARLDTAIVRLPGRVGRPITQAVSRAVFEWIDGVHGMAYASRLDSTEQCWALYDRTPVSFTAEPLSPDGRAHRDAVRSVASLFEIELPTAWV